MQSHDIIRIAGLKQGIDKTAATTYLSEKARGLELYVYPDRNVLSYVKQFYECRAATLKLQQTALSYLIFFKGVGVDALNFIPGLLEYGSRPDASESIAREEWDYLFSVYRQPPGKLIGFLRYGRHYRAGMYVKRYAQPTMESIRDPETEWYSIYTNLLFMKLVDHQQQTTREKLFSYMDLIFQKYEFSTVCIYFAFLLFSTARQKGMLPDSIRDIKSIAWDLYLLSLWYKESIKGLRTKQKIDILMSFDQKLLQLSDFFGEAALLDSRNVEDFTRFFSARNPDSGAEFARRLLAVMANAEDPKRARSAVGSIELRNRYLTKLELIIEAADWDADIDA